MNLDYYQTHSPFTDPGECAHFYRGLPLNPAELIELVQGLLIHKLTARFFHLGLSPVQRKEQFLRSKALPSCLGKGGLGGLGSGA